MLSSIRYSDFVVHEIGKDGRISHLDDLSVPADEEVAVLSNKLLLKITPASDHRNVEMKAELR